MSKKNLEMSAADSAVDVNIPEGEEEAAHTGVASTPVFDFASWLRGVKPIKRTVVLYQRLDLLSDRDVLAAELDQVKYVDQKQAEALREQIQEITEQILNTRMLVTVQAVTTTRYRELLAEINKRDYKGNDERAVFDLMAAQVVEPEGITGAWLQQFDQVAPVQCAKIATAIEQINSTVPDVRATVPLS